MKTEADGLDHGDVGVLVAVAEVQPCPQDGIIAQLVPIKIIVTFYTKFLMRKVDLRPFS